MAQVSLGNWYLEIGLKGNKEAEAGVKKVKAEANAAAQSIKAAFSVATAAIAGFVTAGLAGSHEGQMLSEIFKQLSREIAILFLPVLREVVQVISRMIAWFRSLDGATQAMIQRLATMATVIKIAFMTNPIIAMVGAITLLIDKIGLLPQAFQFAVRLVSVLEDMLDGVLDTLTQFFRRFYEGLNRLGANIPLGAMGPSFAQRTAERRQMERGRPPDVLNAAGGSFEGLAETFRRVQMAGVRQDIPTQQLEEQRRATLLLQRVIDILARGFAERNPTAPAAAAMLAGQALRTQLVLGF